MMKPVPPEASANPVEWAEKHIESLAPDAAKEIEWTLKFGSDERRYAAARDALAMKGLTTKPKEAANIQQAMVFNVTGPMTASGAPVMPFSNAPAALTVDTAKTPVTVNDVPTVQDANGQSITNPDHKATK